MKLSGILCLCASFAMVTPAFSCETRPGKVEKERVLLPGDANAEDVWSFLGEPREIHSYEDSHYGFEYASETETFYYIFNAENTLINIKIIENDKIVKQQH